MLEPQLIASWFGNYLPFHSYNCIKFDDIKFDVCSQTITGQSVLVTELEKAYLTSLGTRIREIRQEKQLGLDSLAEQTGLHRTHLWKIEKGQVNSGLLSYVRIAESLGTPLGQLLPEKA